MKAGVGFYADRVTPAASVEVDESIYSAYFALERETPEVLRRLEGLSPLAGEDALGTSLAETILAAPSFTLRGGTPEVLRGIIARGLGLR